MQSERFHTSLKEVPPSSDYFTKHEEMSFNSYQEALTEKIRLQFFDNIRSSEIRCGEPRDFGMILVLTKWECQSWLSRCILS